MSNTSVVTAFSESIEPVQAARELRNQLNRGDLGFVLFFCSAEYDLEQLAFAMNCEFGGIEVSGCTTAGEITPQGYAKGAITAIGFLSTHFSVQVASIAAMDTFDLDSAQKLVDQLTNSARETQIAPVYENSFALTLLDGLSVQEEQVLASLNSALGNIPHFGGSAGDDVHLAHTHVFANGEFHTGAAVVLLFNTDCDFEVFTTHHMQPLDEKLVVTSADRERRQVQELNAEPAAEEYARIIGVDLDDLTPEVFALNPLAVKIGEEYYVRSIQKVNPDKSLTFYCAVENGIVLTRMTRGDLLSNLELELETIEKRIGEPQLVIGCDCFLRRLEAESIGVCTQTSDFLIEHKVIGFNTYGEQHAGMHINQTFTAVVLGNPSL